jgi:hypothetical protein
VRYTSGMRVTGNCHCGAIRYEAEIDPETVGICHCRDCQSLTGTAFRVFVRAAPGTFKLVSGLPRIYVKTTDSGAKREQAFCETCGSPIYGAAPGPDPRVYSIRAGTLDQRDELRPKIQIWTRSRLPLLDGLDTAPKLETQR